MQTAGQALTRPGGDALRWVRYHEILAGRDVGGEHDGGRDGHPAGRGHQYGEETFGEAIGGLAAVALGGSAQHLVAVGVDDGDVGRRYGGAAGVGDLAEEHGRARPEAVRAVSR